MGNCLSEKLWPHPREIEFGKAFPRPEKIFLAGDCPEHYWDDLKKVAGIAVGGAESAFRLAFVKDETIKGEEEYILDLKASGALLRAFSPKAFQHGFQSFLQLAALVFRGNEWREARIHDWPAYRCRCFMVDLGRSVYSLPLLKRIVRILARLKMNMLHLHLYDDELCGIRFDGLPFGKENPYSLSIPELKELAAYAAGYNVEIVPEMESWGHVGSLVFHRHDLAGGIGVYGGSSFIIKRETFALIEDLTEQIVEIFPGRKGTVHFGMDEANWYLDRSMPSAFTPADLLYKVCNILEKTGKKHDRELTMRVWADHGGRPVPEQIQDRVIIEPWNYWNANAAKISENIVKYSGKDKMRWIMGAGQGMAAHRGAFHATRAWCRGALNSPNLEGVNITFWGWNNLAEKLVTLFAGAYYAWNPLSPADFANIEDYERFDAAVMPVMHLWQSRFRDAFPDAINRDRGPVVYNGYYMWGENHGRPVAPTAHLAETFAGHDYVNEC